MRSIKTTCFILLFTIATTAFYSCKKSNTGGDATIVIHTQHHGNPINGATVYVKFKAEELPANPTSNYDIKTIGEPTQDHITISGLRYGSYFIYTVGYDTSILENVSGGISLKIKWSERKHNINVDVPVTE